jgi:hypothetical protein
VKLVQERAENTLELTGIDNDFLNRTQLAQKLKEKIEQMEYIKLKSFCTTTKKWFLN